MIQNFNETRQIFVSVHDLLTHKKPKFNGILISILAAPGGMTRSSAYLITRAGRFDHRKSGFSGEFAYNFQLQNSRR
jgi:hypothetical protein